MPRLSTIVWVLMPAIALLAACGGAPAAIVPTAATVPISAPAPATAPAATTAPNHGPLADTNPAKPDDKTQGRLRISNCVMDGPRVDTYVNGTISVNGGLAQANLGALDASGYLYLAPATYSVALVPTGKGIDQALLGPLDVPIVAGHRYTLVMLGQVDEQQHTSLVIDETAAYQKAGLSPSMMGHITINNIKGATALSFVQDEWGERDVPYGAFAASAIPAGLFKEFDVRVNDAIESNGAGGNVGGVDFFDCFGGRYPGQHDTHSAFETSVLNTIDFLQVRSDGFAQLGHPEWGFTNFLAALKTTGMADMLATGGPYLVFAPQNQAFAALPKDKLDALMADPKALADLVRNHIVEGYYPYGSLSAAPGLPGPDRTVTNMLGKPLVLLYDSINGQDIGDTGGTLVANGTRINPVSKLLLPAAQALAQSSTTARSIPSSSAEITLSGHTDVVRQANFSPDGKQVVTASDDGTARIWDAATGKELLRLTGHAGTVNGAVFSPDGKTVLTASGDKTARIWDAATGKELLRFSGHTDLVNKAVFSPDAKYVVTTSFDGTARVWDAASAQSILIYKGHTTGQVARVAFSPDGKTVVTTGEDGTAHIWDPLTGKDVLVLRGHTGYVAPVAFSPDGKSVVTGSDDGTARIWDASSGKEVSRFTVAPAEVFAVAFSPDGRYVVTGRNDSVVQLWDIQTGKEVRQFVGHTDAVRYAIFSPDGNYLLTASHDHTARLWRLD